MGLHCEWGARATSRAGKRTQNTPLPNVHSAHLHGSKKTKLPCCCLHGTTFYFNGFLLFSHTTTLLLWTVSWRQVFRSWETSKFDSWTISFEMFMSELEWDRGKGVCVCGGVHVEIQTTCFPCVRFFSKPSLFSCGNIQSQERHFLANLPWFLWLYGLSSHSQSNYRQVPLQQSPPYAVMGWAAGQASACRKRNVYRN